MPTQPARTPGPRPLPDGPCRAGLSFPAAVDEFSRIRIDAASGGAPHAVAGFSAEALAPLLRADAPGAELINGRAAMLGFYGILATELATGQSALEQLASPAGAVAAATVALLTLAASVAPAVVGKVPASRVLPSEGDPYADGPLPYTWSPLAEKVPPGTGAWGMSHAACGRGGGEGVCCLQGAGAGREGYARRSGWLVWGGLEL